MRRCPSYGCSLICVFDQIIEVFADVLDSSRELLVSLLSLLHLLVPISAAFFNKRQRWYPGKTMQRPK